MGKRTRHIKRAFLAYCIICSVLILIIAGRGALERPQGPEPVSLDYGWTVVTDSDAEIYNTTMPYNIRNRDAQIIELYTKIPPNDFKVAAVSFNASQKNVWVYYEGRQIYSYVFDSADKRLKNGSGKVVCVLPELRPEGVLKIRLEKNDDSDVGTLGGIKLIDGAVNERNFIPQYGLMFIIASGLFVTGILMMIAGFAYMGFGVRMASLVYMSLFIISSSMWIICSSKTGQMFISDWALIHNIEYISIYIMPVGLWGFIAESWKSELTRRRYFLHLMAGFFGAAVTLKLTGIADFFELLPVFHVLVMINVPFILYTACRGFFSKDLSLKIFYTGTFFMAGFVLYEISMLYSSAVYDTLDSILPLGFAVMIAFMIASFVTMTREKVSRIYEDRMYKEMAFKDALTGAGNRTKFEADMERFEMLKHDSDSFILVVADANCLKKINDTMGHIIGDLAIKTMADSLKRVFINNEGIYRTGGDEFCVVLSDMDVQEVEQHLERLDELLLCTDLGFPVSMAYGFASYDRKADRPVMDMYKEADEKMYAIKYNYRKISQM